MQREEKESLGAEAKLRAEVSSLLTSAHSSASLLTSDHSPAWVRRAAWAPELFFLSCLCCRFRASSDRNKYHWMPQVEDLDLELDSLHDLGVQFNPLVFAEPWRRGNR